MPSKHHGIRSIQLSNREFDFPVPPLHGADCCCLLVRYNARWLLPLSPELVQFLCS